MLRFTRLHLKTGQKRHSDAAGENQNTTNSKDSKCRNGSCVNFLLCSFQLLVWAETVALMAGYLFRRHHGRLPIPREHHVEPEFGFVPVLSDGTASRLVSLRLTTSFQKTARLVRHGDGAVVCHLAPLCSNSRKRDLDGLSATLLSVGTLSTYTAKSCSIAVFQKHPSRSPKSSMELLPWSEFQT